MEARRKVHLTSSRNWPAYYFFAAQGLAAQGFLTAQGFSLAALTFLALGAQGCFAAQGFCAAHGFCAAQGFLAAQGFFAAQGFAWAKVKLGASKSPVASRADIKTSRIFFMIPSFLPLIAVLIT